MYAFEAGVSFFGLDNLTVTLSYQKQENDAVYTGTLTYSQEILGVSNPMAGYRDQKYPNAIGRSQAFLIANYHTTDFCTYEIRVYKVRIFYLT